MRAVGIYFGIQAEAAKIYEFGAGKYPFNIYSILCHQDYT